MTLHQVHRLVQLALGATAVGFAALAGTFRKSAPKKPLAGGQLGNAGPEVAFGGREFGADEGFGHILYHILYKIGTKSKSKNAIRICSSLDSGLKHLSNQTIWRAKEFGCGIAVAGSAHWYRRPHSSRLYEPPKRLQVYGGGAGAPRVRKHSPPGAGPRGS